MDQDYDEPTRTRTVTPGAPQTSRTIGPGILAAAVAVALATGFGVGWVSHTSSKSSSPKTSAQAAPAGATVAVHGTLQLSHDAYDSTGTTCSGKSGYSDISAGVAVTIGDQTGKTLAVTSLGPGKFVGDGCELDFAATVPSGATLYTVTISHRGTQTFKASDVASGFNMSLGS